jgi:acyl-CoA synthetase (AMP-forming)/AMP-acid ligase II
MDITGIINQGATYWGDKTAVVCGEKKLTFRQVNERANRLANGLLRLGYQPGNHIGSMMHNCSQYIEIFFAQHKLNAVRITLNTRSNKEELVWQINDSEIELLFLGEEYVDEIVSIQANLKKIKHYIVIGGSAPGFIDYDGLLISGNAENPKIQTPETTLSRINYTGGTTGRPKGIMLSRQSDMAVMRNLLLDTVPHLNQNDVFLGLQPLYHAVWSYILPCWVRGATQVITHNFSPEPTLKLIQEEKVTIIKTVPTVLTRIIEHPEIQKYDLSNIHSIIYGASPIPFEKLKKGIQLFGQVFIQNYGQAEAPVTISTLKREDHRTHGTPEEMERLTSAGRPYTFVDVRVVDEEGNEVTEGELGEVIVSGDHMMDGYWNQPAEETTASLRKGWIYTRDIGKFDAQGYLYLVDRKSEMIITGGLNVYPNEVEQILYQHPAVMEAAVFSIPDEQWGESIAAAVALKLGMKASDQELMDLCRKNLASYKKPKIITFHESLPKTEAGKISRRELKEPYWKEKARKVN